MALRPSQRGIRRPYRARVGFDFPEWLGIRKEGDPMSNSPAQPRHAVNVRLVSGEIQNRGGQAYATFSTLDGCVNGIFAPEFKFSDVAKTLFHAGANTGIAAGRGVIWVWTGGGSVKYYDTGLTPSIDDIAISSTNVVFATVRDGGSTKLYEIALEPSTDNTGTNGSYAVASATLRGTITQGTVSFSSCCLLGTTVYVAHGTVASGDARVYSWNGTSFASVDSPAIAGPLLIRATAGSGLLVLRTDTGTFTTEVRKMNSSGTWAAVTAATAYKAHDVAIYNGSTWISGLTNNDTHTASLMKWDETNYTTQLTLSSGAVSPETVERDVKVCLAVASGLLWIARGYNTGFGGTDARIGSFNGEDLTDPVINFSTQDFDFAECHGFALVDGALTVLGDSGGAFIIATSPGSDYDGDWTTQVEDTSDASDTATTPERTHTKAGV